MGLSCSQWLNRGGVLTPPVGLQKGKTGRTALTGGGGGSAGGFSTGKNSVLKTGAESSCIFFSVGAEYSPCEHMNPQQQ